MQKINLRDTEKAFEIHNFLQTSIKNRAPVTLWQSLGGNKKNIFSGRFIAVNQLDKQITLRFKGESKIPLDPELTLYIRGSYMSILFKGTIVDVEGNTVVIQLPKEIKAIENRQNVRMPFAAHQNNEMSFYKLSEETGNKLRFEAEILDITDRGVGIVTRNLIMKHAVEGDQIFITSLAGHQLDPEMSAEIRYTYPIKIIKDFKPVPHYKVGIMFHSALDGFLYEQIIA